jgi:hypothetical protein
MLDYGTPEVVTALSIFWALLPVVIWGSPQWAVLAWLIMGNLDATGPGFASSNSIGWINAIKGIGIPVWLCWRLRCYRTAAVSTPPARLWIALAVYASIAALWSPFPVAAMKLVGNMIGTLLTVVVLEKAARASLLNGRILTVFVVATLLLGVVQTYYYGGVLYGYDGPDEPARFSSFVFAQQYAAILVAFLAIALWHHEFSPVKRLMLVIGISSALIVNGSRTWFIGAGIILVVYIWISFRRVAAMLAFGLGATCLSLLLFFNLNRWTFDLAGEAPSRIVATANAILSGTDTAQRAGLRNLSFRLIVYDSVIDELRAGNLNEIFFGHGTSSGGALSLRIFPHVYNADRLDANRTIHDEWLRALYEWGIAGFVLLLAVFGSLVVSLILHYRHAVWKRPSAALLSFLPAFIAALSTENILAGAGNAVTFGLAILVGSLWTPVPADHLRSRL